MKIIRISLITVFMCLVMAGCSNDKDRRDIHPRSGKGASALGKAAAKSKNPRVFLVVIALGLLKLCPILIPIVGFAYWQHTKNQKNEIVTQNVNERAPPLNNSTKAHTEQIFRCQKCSTKIKAKLMAGDSYRCPACGHISDADTENIELDDDYYYLDEKNQITGPFKIAQLRTKIKESIIDNQTLVAKDGDERWQPIADIKELS